MLLICSFLVIFFFFSYNKKSKARRARRKLAYLRFKYEIVKKVRDSAWELLDKADNVIDRLREELQAERIRSNRLLVERSELQRQLENMSTLSFTTNTEPEDYRTALNREDRRRREALGKLEDLKDELKSKEDLIDYLFRQIQRLCGYKTASKNIPKRNLEIQVPGGHTD